MTGLTLHTERLELRPVAPGDAPRIAALAGDWDIARMTARIPFPFPLTDAERWIAELSDVEVAWSILHSRALIGVCGMSADGQGSAEIGYWIGRPQWGRGFATEAGRAVVAHCFQTAGIGVLTCSHFIDNAASARVIGKLGFRYAGCDRRWCEARQMEVEALHYEKTKPPLNG